MKQNKTKQYKNCGAISDQHTCNWTLMRIKTKKETKGKLRGNSGEFSKVNKTSNQRAILSFLLSTDRTPGRVNLYLSTPRKPIYLRHIMIQLLKTRNKKKIIKEIKEDTLQRTKEKNYCRLLIRNRESRKG